MELPNKWTLSDLDEHPVEEIQVSSTKLNQFFSKLKKEHLTIVLAGALVFVIVGILFYFLVARNQVSTLASNVPANNSPIEVPATVPASLDNPDTSFVEPTSPQSQINPQAVLGANVQSTASPSATPTDTPTPTPTPTLTNTPIPSPTPTPTSTPTPLPSVSPTASSSATPSPT